MCSTSACSACRQWSCSFPFCGRLPASSLAESTLALHSTPTVQPHAISIMHMADPSSRNGSGVQLGFREPKGSVKANQEIRQWPVISHVKLLFNVPNNRSISKFIHTCKSQMINIAFYLSCVKYSMLLISIIVAIVVCLLFIFNNKTWTRQENV